MKNILGFIILSFLAGCSANKDTLVNEKNSIEELYKIVALSKTANGKNGVPCADAVGIIKISNNKISGSATDSINRKFQISGNITGNQISGGFAKSILTVVKFTGLMNRGKPNGEWNDIFQCSGIWYAKKVLTKKRQNK